MRYRSIPTISKYLNRAFHMDQAWTMEHVVPKSFMKHSKRYKNLIKDGHNLILYPRHLNSHRSNYKLVNLNQIDLHHPKTVALDLYGNPVTKEEEKQKVEWLGQLSWKNTQHRLFVPALPYRGEIARACEYMDSTYKELNATKSVYPKTIDQETAQLWMETFQETEWELQKRLIICRLQDQNSQ